MLRLFVISGWVIAFCCSPMIAVTDDWPHWMGAEHDNVWRETGILTEFPESGAKVVWRQEIGGGYGGPAIVGDRVFVMERTKDDGKGLAVENDILNKNKIAGGERVRCLSIKDGSTLWQHGYPCGYDLAYPNGPRCTPCVDGDRVYCLGAMGQLTCLDVATGDVKWEKQLAQAYSTKRPLWGYSSHPVVDGDKLIVPVGGKGSGVVAFNKTNGDEIWRSVTTSDIAYAPLVFFDGQKTDGSAERQLIFWHADGVTGLDPETGKTYWFVKFPEERNPSQTQIATPVVDGNKVLISEFYKGSLYLELSSEPPAAKELWRSRTEDPRNRRSLNAMMATPFVRKGHAYGVGFDGRGQGVFRCIRLKDNELIWDKSDWLGKKPIMFATAFGVENDGVFFLFSDTGELLIVKLSEEGFEELDRAKILEPTTPARGRKVVWCHPAFARGHMIVRNDEEIVCIDLREAG